MNDEIKEILEEIDNKIIPNEHWNKIKDYITNLQQENERLTRFKYNIPNDKTTSVPTITKSYKKEYENYKSRCEKAIEYIKDFENKFKGYAVFPDKRFLDLEELLNILNGGDE